MDYPISVPGVGLVGGKFTDGDPLLSQQASLDPAAWANAVTDELLNVIIAAGLTPNEAQTDQLLQAIQKFAAQDYKNSARVVVKTAIALSGLPTVEGVPLVAGDRVLRALPAADVQNGLYIVAAGAWTRAVDADTSIEVTDGLLVTVEQGAVNADTVWQLVTNAPIVLGTTALLFEQIAGATGVVAGTYKSGTFDKRGRLIAGTNPTTLAGYGITDAVSQATAGQFSNLKASASGLSAVTTITADELVVENGANQYQTLRSVSVNPSFATAGANGLDVGAANSQTASTWYYLWVIWNGATAAGLLSLSPTAPTMPGGYTHKARVGSIRTDSSGNKYPLSFVQNGRRWQYKVVAGSNVANMPVMANGVSGSVSTPTYSAISVSAFVPATAAEINLVLAQNASGAVLIAPNGAYGPNGSMANPPYAAFVGNPGNSTHFNVSMVLESANIYYASGTAGAAMACTGFVDNL